MIIKAINGKTLFQSDFKTTKAALEYCAEHGICLPNADLRKARLSYACLDGLKAPHASFWGADLCGADLGLADLRDCDFRTADFKDACLAETDLSYSDLRGAYFSGTIIEGAVLDKVHVSCSSFWDCDLGSAASFTGLRYLHRGEYDLSVEHVPVIVKGLARKLIIHQGGCLWDDKLYPAGLVPLALRKELFALKTAIEKMIIGGELRNAMSPIPKIESGKGRF